MTKAERNQESDPCRGVRGMSRFGEIFPRASSLRLDRISFFQIGSMPIAGFDRLLIRCRDENVTDEPSWLK
jgi:hypothetical protein